MAKGRYFKWLRELVECDDTKYGDLMVYLFKKEFYWTVAMDENRAEDGKALRDLYSERHPRAKEIDFRQDPCSVLEMMIALARRWQVDILSEDGSEKGFSNNFWEILRNLKLDIYDNSHFSGPEVEQILTKLLDRDYDSKGVGSMFPVKNCTVDMKKTEVWYQLQAYLLVNGKF